MQGRMNCPLKMENFYVKVCLVVSIKADNAAYC